MGLDAPRLALLLLGDSILDLCWLQRFIGSLPRVVYCKMHRYETLTKCNTWGAKYNMYIIMSTLTILTLTRYFTKLPLAFLVV
jgi:hypothetical protein